MAIVRPFQAVRPDGRYVSQIAALPYDVYNREEARKVVEEITYWQEKSFEETGDHFIHASDEWFMIAGLPIPPASLFPK